MVDLLRLWWWGGLQIKHKADT